MTCASPIGYERLVDYWSRDLSADECDAIETHLFACARCTQMAERVSVLVQAFRTQIPSVISASEVAALRAKGLAIVDNMFVPGERAPVTFGPGIDLLVHHLVGLDLADAERVEVTVRSESHGNIFEEPFAPFDRERGEVMIACQRHFEALPPDIVFDVRVHRAGVEPAVSTYLVPHHYA